MWVCENQTIHLLLRRNPWETHPGSPALLKQTSNIDFQNLTKQN